MDQNKIYTTLLTQPALPPELQRRILAFGKASRDKELLVKLAHYRDLTDECDKAIRKIPQAKVRIAWLTRPARAIEEVTKAVAGEKRVGALKSILDAGTLAPDLVTTIANVAVERNSASLAMATLATQSVDDVTLARSLVAAAASGLGSDQCVSPLAKYLAAHPQYAQVALESTKRPSDLDQLMPLVKPMPADLQTHLLDTLIVPFVATGAYGALRLVHSFEQVTGLTPQSVETLRAAVNRAAAQGSYRTQWQAVSSRLDGGEDYRANRTALLQESTTTTDMTRYGELTLIANQFADNEMYRALSANVHAPVDTVLGVFARRPDSGALCGVAIDASDDIERITLLVNGAGAYSSALESHPRRDEILDATIAAAQTSQPWVNTAMLTRAVRESWLSHEQFMSMPLSLASSFPTPMLAIAVGALGADPTQWELFETFLVDGSDMSLRFAIESAQTLTK